MPLKGFEAYSRPKPSFDRTGRTTANTRQRYQEGYHDDLHHYAKFSLGSISAVSRVRCVILPEESLFGGMSAGSFSRTAAGNRA